MGQVVLHGNQRNENSRWRNFPVWLEITALIVLLTGIETSYVGAYIWECHSTWQFKPYVPTFSARLCSQNQAMSAQISQKFKNKVLSLKSVQPKKKQKRLTIYRWLGPRTPWAPFEGWLQSMFCCQIHDDLIQVETEPSTWFSTAYLPFSEQNSLMMLNSNPENHLF